MPRRRKKRLMPNMQGAAVQCCMCITGVFMFLGGLIMLATGICLILNYGVFDVNLLPPDLQNDDGKKTVGIILTSCGLVAILISVIVSALYLCTKQKSATIDPDSLTRIPNTARNQTPDKPDAREGRSRRHSNTNKTHPMPNGTQRSQSQTTQKFTPGSAEVKHPRQSYQKRHKKRKYPRPTGRRLEEIKEQDAISRKTIIEGGLSQERDEEYADTQRSGSFSSEMTLDDHTKIPKVSLDDYDNNHAPSETSSRMSQDSEMSQTKFLDNDKSRRELQFLPSKNNAFESDYQGQFETVSIDSRQRDNFSINSDTLLVNKGLGQDIALRDLSDTNSAGGITPVDGAVGYTPEVLDSDGGDSMASFKAIHKTEMHGGNTLGRMTPQIDELESYTKFESESGDRSYDEVQ